MAVCMYIPSSYIQYNNKIIIALRHVYRFTVYIGSNSYSSYKV